jgi:hypothetical protein
MPYVPAAPSKGTEEARNQPDVKQAATTKQSKDNSNNAHPDGDKRC